MFQLRIHLVTWNGERYISHLFDSLRKQTNKHWQLSVLDNGSTDNTASLIKKEIEALDTEVTLIENDQNLGFAAGHNMLFRQNDAAYVLIINQDMMLEPHCIERLLDYADSHKEVAVIAPRIMRWDADTNNTMDIVDAIGLKIFRSRRVVEQYAGAQWHELHPKIHSPSDDLEMFGASGAAILFRKHVLDTVSYKTSVFDESFGSYKEDVDLAFRLRSLGFTTKALLSAVVYHDRSSGTQKTFRDSDAARNKLLQPKHVRYQSYKNHIISLWKNEYWQNAILDFPWIAWYELKKFVWLLLFDRQVLTGLREVFRLRKAIKAARSAMTSKRSISWCEMRRQWTRDL